MLLQGGGGKKGGKIEIPSTFPSLRKRGGRNTLVICLGGGGKGGKGGKTSLPSVYRRKETGKKESKDFLGGREK